MALAPATLIHPVHAVPKQQNSARSVNGKPEMNRHEIQALITGHHKAKTKEASPKESLGSSSRAHG